MKRLILISLAAVIAITFFVGGFISAYLMQQQVIKSLEEQIRDRDGEIANLNEQLVEERNKVSSLSSELESLKALLSKVEQAEKEARQVLEEKEAELAQLKTQLGESDSRVKELEAKIARISNALEKLSNDRVLLSWLRNDVPSDREGALRHWNETRDIAARSDPSLAIAVDKIIASLGVFFDWIESFPQDVTYEQGPLGDLCSWTLSRPDAPYNLRVFCEWLFSQPPGVDEYSQKANQFIEEVYLVVISHIDELSKAIKD